MPLFSSCLSRVACGRFVALPLLALALAWTGCSGSQDAASSSSPASTAASYSVEASRHLLADSSLAPSAVMLGADRMFYRSPTAHLATSAQASSVSPTYLQMAAYVVGLTTEQGVQWALHLMTAAPDSAIFSDFTDVDLYGRRLVLRRGHPTPTVSAYGPRVVERRTVPLSLRDVQQVARADSVKIYSHNTNFWFKGTLRADLQQAYAATPAGVPVDSGAVDARLTVFHTPAVDLSYPGGVRGIAQAITLPDGKKNNRQGTVAVDFVVMPDGSVDYLRLLRSASPEMNAAVVNAVRGLDKFTPARHGGRPVPALADPIVVRRGEGPSLPDILR